jgi:hypothetical protein
MSYKNPLMVELMVPRHPDVASRIHGFYEGISWEHRNDTGSEFDTIVHPYTSEGLPPTIAYWQTENAGKIGQFVFHEDTKPSVYARGLRLPRMQELVEVCLVVPSDDDVHEIFERGGELLVAHAHVLPREHAGRQEFRYTDPFNYAFRVTADPGWEIERAK